MESETCPSPCSQESPCSQPCMRVRDDSCVLVPMLTPKLNVALAARQVGRIAADCSQAKWSSRARTRSFHVTFTQHSLAEDSGSAPLCSGAAFTGGGPCDLHLNTQPVCVSLREAEAEGRLQTAKVTQPRTSLPLIFTESLGTLLLLPREALT